MRTFEDLVFKKHPILFNVDDEKFVSEFKNHKQAVVEFDNGYVLSVVIGDKFYSNGIDTYECYVMKNGKQIGDVLGYQTKKQVEELIKKIEIIEEK